VKETRWVMSNPERSHFCFTSSRAELSASSHQLPTVMTGRIGGEQLTLYFGL
jgi:hypothetical protein